MPSGIKWLVAYSMCIFFILNIFFIQPAVGINGTYAEQNNITLKHSNRINSGQLWGNYWTPGTDNGSQSTACTYCHGNDFCQTGEIGRPLIFNSIDPAGADITDSSYWCSSCHYQGYLYYDEMVVSFLNDSLPVPPEITGNITYGADQDIDVYFNHNYVDKDDASCRECHGKHLDNNATITDFMHDLSSDTYADCIHCHKLNSVAPQTINIIAYSNSTHAGLNSAASTTVDPANKACWACHGNGIENDIHPQYGIAPRTCESCHIPGISAEQNAYGAVELYSHQSYALSHTKMKTNADCYTCHDNSEMLVSGADGGNMIAHYVKDVIDRSKNPPKHNVIDTVGKDSGTQGCVYCHLNSTNAMQWGNAPDPSSDPLRSHNETTNAQCWECHVTGTSTFHESAVETKCEACHFEYDYMNITGYPEKFVNGTKYNMSVHGRNWTLIYCKDCHTLPDPTWEHGWKWCDDCHVVQDDPINETGRHKITADPANYTIGNVSVIQITDCTTCHDPTSYNNAVNTFNGTDKDCRYCHSNPNSYYFEGEP